MGFALVYSEMRLPRLSGIAGLQYRAALAVMLVCGSLAGQGEEHDPRPGYVGDAACLRCHAAESGTYAHTAHRVASALASERSVLGSFRSGENLLTIHDEAKSPELPSLKFSCSVAWAPTRSPG